MFSYVPHCGLVLARLSIWAVVVSATAEHSRGSEPDAGPALAQAAAARPLSVEPLLQIEKRALPPVIEAGPARLSDLPAYYLEQNDELRQRFERAKAAYENGQPRPFRMMTLIAGAAGIGKTFLKGEVFRKDYPEEAICKFDIRELYESWQESGLVERREDLYCQDVVLNGLLAVREDQPLGIRGYLQEQDASFYVIDSLDEIHPDDYDRVLDEIERFVFRGDREFVHVVVLGRALAFRDYWHKRAGFYPRELMAIYMLQPPVFRTTGDLLVSSWNYHTWRYKLRWSQNGQAYDTMPFDVYCQWVKAGFPKNGRFNVHYEPNQNMDPRVHRTLEQWATRYPVVNAALYNLAGNTFMREIAEEYALSGRAYDERAVMEEYLDKWLERDTKSDDRPSAAKPDYLDLYMRLIEGVAAKYLGEQRLNENGFFTVRYDDAIDVEWEGQRLSFPVFRILNRSGLKYLDPREPGSRNYRFEPIWFHRLLVEKHNDRVAAR